MTETEKVILSHILELEATLVVPITAGPRPSLRPHLERLRELTHSLPPGTDPTLLHYLHKQSWEKARYFLQGREAENAAGNCRHV